MSKWINEGGIFYPVGDFRTYASPGAGIFNLVKSPNPMDTRLGLVKVGDKFEFPFKIYDLGIDKFMDKVKRTWNSEYYEKKKQNLGIILNGTKGTGKSLSAKILCNELELPVIVINNYIDGIIHFISSLEFECIILIDEAEKTFSEQIPDASQTLLKIIDGVTNKSRKLYILTTNYLKLNENLLGRPGRIRYIKEFENISSECVAEYLKDNLIDKSKTDEVIDVVGSLKVSTIDTLKSIIDEFNIHGCIEDIRDFNLTFESNYSVGLGFMVSKVDLSNEEVHKRAVKETELVSNLIKRHKDNESLGIWIYEETPKELKEDLDRIGKYNISNRNNRTCGIATPIEDDDFQLWDDDELEATARVVSSYARDTQDGAKKKKKKSLEIILNSFQSVFTNLSTYSISWTGNEIRVGSYIDGLGKISREIGNGWYAIDHYCNEYWIYIEIPKKRPMYG